MCLQQMDFQLYDLIFVVSAAVQASMMKEEVSNRMFCQPVSS